MSGLAKFFSHMGQRGEMRGTNNLKSEPPTALQLDHVNQCARLGAETISLSPKAFSVLAYLAERSGRLVTKRELLDAIWPDVHVTEGVLKRAVLEIRKALADTIDEPQFIQTLHRRGYRFLSQTVPEQQSAELTTERSGIIERKQELAQLDGWLDEALAGSRQIVFLAGEAGLGKSTLIDQFERRLLHKGVTFLSARCLPQLSGREPFLPIFDMLDQLVRTIGQRFVEILRIHAPNWLLQMPGLFSADHRSTLQAGGMSATPERMIWEMAAALEAISLKTPMVMAFEDLHWSDAATINLLSAIAMRTSPAKLLIVITYRPAEAGAAGSPLRTAQNELGLYRRCEVLSLSYLSEQDTAEMLFTHLGDQIAATMIAPAVHRRTKGNPLLIVCLIDELQRTGKLDAVRTVVPEALQLMFERQATQRSGPEQDLLDAAAVAGGTFSSTVIASALGWTEEEVETHCDTLVRQQAILKLCPTAFSDVRYGFIHSLCRDALYLKIPPARRARLQARLTQSVESSLGMVSVHQPVADTLAA